MLLPRVSSCLAGEFLSVAMGAKGCNGERRQREGSTAPLALRLRFLEAAFRDPSNGPTDLDATGVEVHIGPSQAKQVAL
ncbi:MAG: hypothetical protein HY534_05270 [Chloroflexi bacterium]|nr:hypothetical protein [Chloroflexota bacterium]